MSDLDFSNATVIEMLNPQTGLPAVESAVTFHEPSVLVILTVVDDKPFMIFGPAFMSYHQLLNTTLVSLDYQDERYTNNADLRHARGFTSPMNITDLENPHISHVSLSLSNDIPDEEMKAEVLKKLRELITQYKIKPETPSENE